MSEPSRNADSVGHYEQVGWRSPVRADGVKDGKWWHYNLDERHPDDAEALFVWVPPNDSLSGGEDAR